MLKRITFSFCAVLLVVSLTFAGNIKPEKAKTISADYTNSAATVAPAKLMSKVSASQLGFTDYDYAGNGTVNEQVWPYDIDGDGTLDPVGTFMQRFNVTEDGTRRNVMFLGLGGEFTTLDVSDRTLYTGWGTIQSMTTGPWAGHAMFMVHQGSIARLTVYNLADFSTVYFHAETDIANNFPTFAYLDDGTISATATDAILRTGSTADPLAYTEVGQEMVVGPSEYPIRRSPNGMYLAAVSDDAVSEIRMYVSNDGGATWSDEVIGTDGDPITDRPGSEALFTNFGQRTYAVDNNGVVHVGMNGYALGVNGADTTFIYPALYWNSRDRNWLPVSDPAEEGSDLDGIYPGNGIGNSYPTPSVSPDGQVVSVLWQAPEFDGGVVQTYPGDGSADTYECFYTDIKHVYSADGGKTFSTPMVVAGNPMENDYYPSAYDFLTNVGDQYTVRFMWMTDAIGGCSLFGENSESEDTYWSYEEVTFTATPVGVEDEELVNTFSLQQNYPNPFNPSTTIKYSVPQLTDVSVKVFDVLGKEVATLVNTQQAQGVYEVNFDASNLASGMYIYTINAGSFISSKKMLLMK